MDNLPAERASATHGTPAVRPSLPSELSPTLICSLELAEPDEQPRVSSPCNLVFRVKNNTPEEINLHLGGDYRNRTGRPDSFTCTVEKEHSGTFLPILDCGMNRGGMIAPSRVLPGECHLVKLNLSHWAAVTEPSLYTVTFMRQFEWNAGKGFDTLTAAKGSFSASLDIRFAAGDRAVQLVQIGRLGKQLMTNSSLAEESADTLSTVQDPAAVPHWISALQSLSSHVRFVAVSALGKYPANASAIRALEEQVTDSSVLRQRYSQYEEKVAYEAWQQHRLHAVQSIASAGTPASISFLLTLVKDGNESVRLTVLQSICAYRGRYVGNQLQEALQTLAADSSFIVKGEAMRFIKAGITWPRPSEKS